MLISAKLLAVFGVLGVTAVAGGYGGYRLISNSEHVVKQRGTSSNQETVSS